MLYSILARDNGLYITDTVLCRAGTVRPGILVQLLEQVRHAPFVSQRPEMCV